MKRAATDARDVPGQRHARRKSQAPPTLEKIRAWCNEKLGDLLPKYSTAGDVNYVLKNWGAFTRYLEDGRIAIDNNAAERALRPITLGRNIWPFAAAVAGQRVRYCHESDYHGKSPRARPAGLSHRRADALETRQILKHSLVKDVRGRTDTVLRVLTILLVNCSPVRSSE